MKAKDACRKAPVTVGVETSIAQAAEIMNAAVVGAVVVVDKGSPIGIVTDRDIVTRGVAKARDLSSPIVDIMSINLVTISGDADFREAIPLFSKHAIRRLPVVEDESMVGMLALDDLVIDLVFDLATLVRPIVGEVIFGHTEPDVPGTS